MPISDTLVRGCYKCTSSAAPQRASERGVLFTVDVTYMDLTGSTATTTWHCPYPIRRFYIQSEEVILKEVINYPVTPLGDIDKDLGVVMESIEMVEGDTTMVPWVGQAEIIGGDGNAIGEPIFTPGRVAIPADLVGNYRVRFKGHI